MLRLGREARRGALVKAWVVEGSKALCGAVRAAGAKNAVLPMMAAAVLSDRPVVLRRAPRLRDVQWMSGLLSQLGVCVQRDGDSLVLDAHGMSRYSAPWSAVRRMRAGFCVLGPLLARFGRAVVPLPGGCRLGDRPVDLHLAGLRALGAKIEIRAGCVFAEARRLRGAEVVMSGRFGPSVTGTAQLMCAAAAADGESIIRNAAREPEIIDLARLLSAMGAAIDGAGDSIIRIRGSNGFGPAEHRVIADRIEAATYLFAAAVTGGDVLVEDVEPADVEAPLAALSAAGCSVEIGASAVRLAGPERLLPVDVCARPHPGFPTDLQAPWAALMATADGRSRVVDEVFPQRFSHVAELRRLGANIHVEGHAAETVGRKGLDGAPVSAGDLRAGAAMVLAALAARGTTTILGVHHIERGYERPVEKLRALGAKIHVGSALPRPSVHVRLP